jgi:DNA-binding transcriptional LysR family regulator
MGYQLLDRKATHGSCGLSNAAHIPDRTARGGRITDATRGPRSFIAPLLRQFMIEFPEVELDLQFIGDGADSIKEGFVVAIRTGNADSRLMPRHRVYSRRCIVGSAGSFALHGTLESIADLAKYVAPHRRMSTTGNLEAWSLACGCAAGRTILVSTPANTLGALIQFVQGGAGLACIPSFSVCRQLRNGALISALDR